MERTRECIDFPFVLLWKKKDEIYLYINVSSLPCADWPCKEKQGTLCIIEKYILCIIEKSLYYLKVFLTKLHMSLDLNPCIHTDLGSYMGYFFLLFGFHFNHLLSENIISCVPSSDKVSVVLVLSQSVCCSHTECLECASYVDSF